MRDGSINKRSLAKEVEALSSVVRVWKFTAGHTGGRGFFDNFLANNWVALGYVYNHGLKRVRTYGDLAKLKRWGGEFLSENVRQQMWDFLSMNKGDVVALKLKNYVVALGVILTGELVYDTKPLKSRYFRSDQDYPNRKKVLWLAKFESQPIAEENFSKSFRYPQGTIHEISDRGSKIKVLSWLISYRDSKATLEEKHLINQIGTLDNRREPRYRRIQTTKEIAEKEYSAYEKVIKYEEEVEHRKVIRTYHVSLGYDLESKSETDTRFIEVKSRRGTFPVVLTESELKAAKRLKNSYFLYVVTSDDQILRVRNPSCLNREPVNCLVWELKDWLQKAENVTQSQ